MPIRALYVYTNIIKESFVGNQKSQISRILPLEKNINNDQVIIKSKSFNPILFFPLRMHSFDMIEIEIRDATGRYIVFKSGRVIVTFMFKKINWIMNNNFDFCTNFDCDYDKYYLIQAGGSQDLKEISYYTGRPFQRGYNPFTKFARNYGIPILKYLKNKTMKFGKNFIQEILSGEDIKVSAKNNLKRTINESLDDLKDKVQQTGNRRNISKRKIIKRIRKKSIKGGKKIKKRKSYKRYKNKINKKKNHSKSKSHKKKNRKLRNIFE